MSTQSTRIPRVLVIDDDRTVHEAFRAILAPERIASAGLDAMAAALFDDRGDAGASPAEGVFELTVASQGEEGVDVAAAAVRDGRPFDMAFVDMRMPPGLDGVETIERLWAADPDLEVVICTAYSDYSWDQIIHRLGKTHRLLLLRKPFDKAEAWQMASAQSRKRHAEETARTCDALRELNARLEEEIAARARAEDKLKHDALHDSLTALPNRLLLTERLERCMARAKRNPEYLYAVMFLDLDEFKAINDTHGHAIGDQVLIEVANRLNASLRSLDTASRLDDQTPARMGGDEFVILLDGLRSFDDAMQVAHRVHDAVSQVATFAGHTIAVSASLGLALGSAEHAVPDDVLRDADAALYHSKNNGKGRVHVFDDGIRRQVVQRLRLSADLRSAIHLQQLRLLYQPILSLESGRIESFEALVRWDHPTLGAVAPAQFIPIAEETGTIQEVGRWVLRESCQQLRLWHEQIPSRSDLAISVNVSPKQLAAGDFVENLLQTLRDIGLEGRHLIIEVTESTLVENIAVANDILEKLRAIGVRIHLDDFGVGYSSLSYLHQLPFDAIKIDRSFVKDMKLDAVHANTIMAIQAMALNRHMRVIAEGIETVEQLVQLQALDCAMGQGFYLARPIDAQAARTLLEEGAHPARHRRTDAA